MYQLQYTKKRAIFYLNYQTFTTFLCTNYIYNVDNLCVINFDISYAV